jgi:hypothetical protein
LNGCVVEEELVYVRVIMKNRAIELVKVARLDELIDSHSLLAFRRLDGWAIIGRDAIRGAGGDYRGPERRVSGRRHEHSQEQRHCSVQR